MFASIFSVGSFFSVGSVLSGFALLSYLRWRSAAQTVLSLSLRVCVLAFSQPSAFTSTCSTSLKSLPSG